MRMPDWGERLLGVLLPIGSAYITCNTHRKLAYSCGRIARQGMVRGIFTACTSWCVHDFFMAIIGCFMPIAVATTYSSLHVVISAAKAQIQQDNCFTTELSWCRAHEADLEAVA